MTNIRDFMVANAIQAGGPGSGPHPGSLSKSEALLKKHGWSWAGAEDDYSDYSHPKHGEITMHDDNTWEHNNKVQNVGSDTLERYLGALDLDR